MWTVSRFVTGAIYDGEWLDNRKHGQGSYYYTDGSRYEGKTFIFTDTFMCSVTVETAEMLEIYRNAVLVLN